MSVSKHRQPRRGFCFWAGDFRLIVCAVQGYSLWVYDFRFVSLGHYLLCETDMVDLSMSQVLGLLREPGT